MPTRASSPCPEPGCPTLTPGGPCDLHRRAARRTQARQRRASGDPSMDAYSTDDWKRRRRAYLTQHPHCVDCGAKATQPDHVPPRELLLALGVHDPDHPQWLTPRCATCHSRKTRTVDQPLLRRWQAGENPQQLAEEAMRMNVGVG